MKKTSSSSRSPLFTDPDLQRIIKQLKFDTDQFWPRGFAFAKVDLGLTDDEFWDMDPFGFMCMVQRAMAKYEYATGVQSPPPTVDQSLATKPNRIVDHREEGYTATDRVLSDPQNIWALAKANGITKKAIAGATWPDLGPEQGIARFDQWLKGKAYRVGTATDTQIRAAIAKLSH